MKIPIISDYIERKKQEALAELEVIKDYFKKENNPSSDYDEGRKILDSADKITNLRKIKKVLGRRYFLWGHPAFPNSKKEIEEFQKLSDEEKRESAKSQIRIERTRRLESLLEKWAKDAEPILEKIINQNSEQMIGFEYYSHCSGGGYGEGEICERIARGNETPTIYFKGFYGGKKFYIQPYSSYGKYDLEETDVKSITSKILRQILPNPLNQGVVYLTEWVNPEEPEQDDIRVIDFSEGTDKTKMGKLVAHRESSVLVKKRNQIVKEIEKRTGKNLKQEVLQSETN